MNRPMTIDGALSRMSLTKRTTKASCRVPAIFRQIGAGKDADRRADQHAPARHHQAADDGVGKPARAMPGGGVVWVNNVERQGRDALPEQRTRMNASQTRPNTAAPQRQGDEDRVGRRRA